MRNENPSPLGLGESTSLWPATQHFKPVFLPDLHVFIDFLTCTTDDRTPKQINSKAIVTL